MLLIFFKDCLANRHQRVVLNGEHSAWGKIKAGVPQGSVLGPLFLVYINDLIKEITCPIKLFADDTSLYTLVDDQIESANLFNYNLHKAEMWGNRRLVKFNPTKTKLMNITFKKDCNFTDFPLSFCNTQLSKVK